jgi:HSP20 family protein
MKKFLKKLSGMADKMNIELKDQATQDDENYEDSDYAEGTDNDLVESDDTNQVEAEQADEDKEWIDTDYEEGQLSIDVYQTPNEIVVKSTIAGVKPEDIDISINNDMLTIRGRREMRETIKDSDYLYRECYWGSFSRSIILPVEIEPEKIEAVLENGVLTVTLPKARSAKPISIKVKEK